MPEVVLDEFTMNYEERGTGTPVVLLHAFPFNSRMWRLQMDALAREHRVIAPDLRGFGGSKYEEPFTMELLADDVHRLLQKIDALPAVVVGKSMGGYVALELGEKHAEDLLGLVLAGTRAQGETSDEKIKRVHSADDVQKQGIDVHIQKMLPKLLSKRNEQTRPELLDELRSIMNECPKATMIHGILGIMSRPDHMHRWPKFQVPTLIMVGADDQITPPSLSEEMQRARPDAKLVVLEGCGHMAAMEDPERFNASLREFVASLHRR